MDCKIEQDLLQAYIDGTIEPLEKIVIEEHLRNCPQCARELNKFKILSWDLHNLTSIEIPVELATVREAALSQCLTATDYRDKEKLEIKDIYSIQYSNIKSSVRFMKFLPGTRLVQKASGNLFSWIIGL